MDIKLGLYESVSIIIPTLNEEKNQYFIKIFQEINYK